MNGGRTVILRFGLVLNSSEGVLKRLMMPVKLGLGSGIGSGEQYMSWIHISDLCELILFSLKKPSVRGIYNAVSPSPVTNKDMMHSIATHMGKPFFMPNVPAFLLRLLYGEMSSMILGGSRVSCAKIESAGFTFKYNTIDQALNDLIKK